METERYGHVSIARSTEFDFFGDDGAEVGSVKFDRFGVASTIINGATEPLLAGVDNGAFSFSFTKSGQNS